MNDQTDQQLLREFAEHRSEAAFTELVRRYVNLVHSAAFRMTGDAHAAQDVTQAVFVALAKDAARLTLHPVLSGWLHTTARNLAAKNVRATVRRQDHEQEAAAMNELLSTAPDASWEEIAPHLDAALGELSEPDRDAVLLRYFEKKSAAEIATRLDISAEAAQKRVGRAVDRLREFFTKRGVTIGAGGLGVVISTNAVQAAPAGLAVTISAAALVGTAVTTSTVIAATTKAITMTTLQKTVITATIAVLTGVGIYEARNASQLRAQVKTLREEQAALQEQLRLASDNTVPAPEVALTSSTQPRATNMNELLRLRGEVGRLRRENAEANVPITHDTVTARYENAQALARSGDAAGALKEFLWCYDEGMPRVNSYSGVRNSYLLSSIAKLGEKYPAALTELRTRRDQALQRCLQSPNDHGVAADFASLNRTLNEENYTVSILDQLPAEDSRRKTLAYMAYDQLVEVQRYGDAVSGRSYANLSMLFGMANAEVPLPANTPGLEQIQQRRRTSLIASTAKGVEALAGAGDLVHARKLAEQLLAYDNSTSTQVLLQQHAARAGQPNLLSKATNP